MAEQNNSYPSISEKNWWTIRERFKASIPQLVSTTYIKTLLSMANDNSANSNVIVPLKRIGLIDGENKPTELANDWRIDDKYKNACETILKTVYPTELLDLFSSSDVDRKAASRWFMNLGVGQGTADKMAAFFALLKSGEIKEKKASSTPKTKTNAPKQIKDSNKTGNGAETHQPLNSLREARSANCPNLHIDLQIHISPNSTPEQIETIFASMAKHLYGLNE